MLQCTDQFGLPLMQLRHTDFVYIVRAIVDVPEQVTVNEVEAEHTVVIELRVANSDMGLVIGKQGRNVQAIRTILSAASGKTRKRYMLEIVE